MLGRRQIHPNSLTKQPWRAVPRVPFLQDQSESDSRTLHFLGPYHSPRSSIHQFTSQPNLGNSHLRPETATRSHHNVCTTSARVSRAGPQTTSCGNRWACCVSRLTRSLPRYSYYPPQGPPQAYYDPNQQQYYPQGQYQQGPPPQQPVRHLHYLSKDSHPLPCHDAG